MTREQAIQKLQDVQGFGAGPWAEKWIDSFLALGMLKLEEPKGKIDEFWIALGDRRGTALPHAIAYMLDEFGIKLVEK